MLNLSCFKILWDYSLRIYITIKVTNIFKYLLHTVLQHWMTNWHCFFVGQQTFLVSFGWRQPLVRQPVGFNQELDLFCSIPVINWLIISGLVPLNYGADCKWTWWSSELEATYTTWDTSSRFLPRLVPPTLCCGCPNDVEEIFPCSAPFTTRILSS